MDLSVHQIMQLSTWNAANHPARSIISMCNVYMYSYTTLSMKMNRKRTKKQTNDEKQHGIQTAVLLFECDVFTMPMCSENMNTNNKKKVNVSVCMENASSFNQFILIWNNAPRVSSFRNDLMN